MEPETTNAPVQPVTAQEFLADAASLLDERGAVYDKAGSERSMQKIVQVFNFLTGHQLTEVEGWRFMMVLKEVRATRNGFHQDSYLDLLAYTALMAEAARNTQ